MQEKTETKYVKRTQKDYSMSFKLEIIKEAERGEFSIGAAARKYGIQNSMTVTMWLRKYGKFNWEN